jgi:membrane protein required for colicin V production
MNPFDAAVLVIALMALVGGFAAGLLRSLATILAYVVAGPVALTVAPRVTSFLAVRNLLPNDVVPNAASYVPLVLLLVIAIVLGALMRGAVGGAAGQMGAIDRVLGAVLGVARVGLLAVVFVLVLEAVVPPGGAPDWFKQSKLRPYLSAAGAQGLGALPPPARDAIERLKRERPL